MKKLEIVALKDLANHLQGQSEVTSQLLSPEQHVHVPPLAYPPFPKPHFVRGGDAGWGENGYNMRIGELILHTIEGDITVRGNSGIVIVNETAVLETLCYLRPTHRQQKLSSRKEGRIESHNGSDYFVPSEPSKVFS